jgi:hypothetical protein
LKGCEQVEWRRVIKVEGDYLSEGNSRSKSKTEQIELIRDLKYR